VQNDLARENRVLGIAEQTLHNWVKADRQRKLGGPGAKPVSPEQMKIARLRAENARLKMERDILGKPWRTSRRSDSEARLHRAAPPYVADFVGLRNTGGQFQRLPRAQPSRHASTARPQGFTCASASLGMWDEA
jgi:hypothetical protein